MFPQGYDESGTITTKTKRVELKAQTNLNNNNSKHHLTLWIKSIPGNRPFVSEKIWQLSFNIWTEGFFNTFFLSI